MLKRLRTDRIDLLYQHRVDPEVPIEDVAGAVKDLMAQGKVLHWGLSEMGLNTLRAPCRAARYRRSERIFDAVARAGSGGASALRGTRHRLRPMEPVGVGFLTGAIDANTRFAEGDIRGIESRFAPENLTLAGSNTDVTSDYSGVDVSISDSITHTGWVLGAGFETKISSNMTARLEYLHYDFGGADIFYRLDPLSDAYDAFGDAELDVDVIRLAVNFLF